MGFFSITQHNNHNNKYSNDTKFWKYYGIFIPYTIESIPSIDGVNRIGNRGGTETLMESIEDCSYTLKEYQTKYANKGTDGKLYWKQ